MTLDERLENIARNLDTLTRLHVDSEHEREESDREYLRRFQQNEQRLAHLMDSMNRLGRNIESHEQRRDNLEGGR